MLLLLKLKTGISFSDLILGLRMLLLGKMKLVPANIRFLPLFALPDRVIGGLIQPLGLRLRA